MTKTIGLSALACVLAGHIGLAQASGEIEPTRGELLYSVNCLGCHSDHVHWRDAKRVRDWSTLVAEIRHWEGFSQLGWHADDVDSVARYLNAAYYHLPPPERSQR